MIDSHEELIKVLKELVRTSSMEKLISLRIEYGKNPNYVDYLKIVESEIEFRDMAGGVS